MREDLEICGVKKILNSRINIAFPAVLMNVPGNLVIVKQELLYYNESIRARGPEGPYFTGGKT